MDKNEKKLAELHSLRAWCMTVIEYAMKIDPASSPLMFKFKVAVDSSFYKRNMKALKTIKRDLSELIGDLSVAQRKELSERLHIEPNDPMTDLNKKTECILSKGHIDNEDDYRFLVFYIDYLLEVDATEGIPRINEILLRYLNGNK